jgi:hypothetical protein
MSENTDNSKPVQHPSSFFDYKKGELQQYTKEQLEALKSSLESAEPKSNAAKRKKETALRYIDDTLNDTFLTGDTNSLESLLSSEENKAASKGPKSVPPRAPTPANPLTRSKQENAESSQQSKKDKDSSKSDKKAKAVPFAEYISSKMSKITIGLAQIGEDVTQGKKGLDLSGWASRLAEQKEGLQEDWKDVIDENRWIINWVTPKTRLGARVAGTGIQSWSNNNGAYVSEYVGEYTDQFSKGVGNAQNAVAAKVQEIRERFGSELQSETASGTYGFRLPSSEGEMSDPTSNLKDFQEDGDQGQK